MTENDWVKAVNDSAPLLLPNYYIEKPMYKADLCQLSELYLRGGYYMDVDQVATLPYQTPRESSFVIVKGADWPKYGVAQAFMAASPGHSIIYKNLRILTEVSWVKRSRDVSWACYHVYSLPRINERNTTSCRK